MIYLKILFLTFLSLSLSYAGSQLSPHEAARQGDLQTLRNYRFHGKDLYLPDERGFTPYELAALGADPEKPGKVQQHVELMLWLKEFNSPSHRYGKASIQLVQAGLRALGYPIAYPDGIMGSNTEKAIKAYQKDNDLATTGRLGPQWLGVFFQDVLKDIQYKLTQLGFDTRGTDGLMGKNTQRAFLKYRQAKQLGNPNYTHLDALLVMNVDSTLKQQEKEKEATQKKQQKAQQEQQVRYIQSGLSALGYRIGRIDGMFGSKTANAIKAFQKKQGMTPTGKMDDDTLKVMHTQFLKNTQSQLNFVGYSAGTPDGIMGNKTQTAISNYRNKNKLPEGRTNDGLLMRNLKTHYLTQKEKQASQNKPTTTARLASDQTQKIRFAQAGLRTLGYLQSVDGVLGPNTQNAIKRFQKRYSIPNNGKLGPMTLEKMQSIFLKETQRKLNTLGHSAGQPDGKMGSRTQRALQAFAKKHNTTERFGTQLIIAIDDAYDRRPSKQTVKSQQKTSQTTRKKRPSQDVVFTQPKKAPSNRRLATHAVKARHAKGRMSFQRKGGRVVGCRIAGRNIPIEWCEPFYPLPKNNHCEATFKSSSGAVINLWCK